MPIELFLDAISDGFVALDADWKITYANTSAGRICGLMPETMIDRNYREVFAGLAGALFDVQLRQAAERRQLLEFETHYLSCQRWFHIKVLPLPVAGLAVFFHDITERKQTEAERVEAVACERQAQHEAQTLHEVAASIAGEAEHELQRREAAGDATSLLGAIVDSSDDAIISKDLNGVITSWNNSAQRLFGYTAEEAVGRSVAELLIPQDRQEEEPKILERLARGERVDHFETVRHHKDGTLLDISLTISPIKDQQGRIIGASKIARDITERRRFEKRLAEQAHLLDLTGDAIIGRNRQDRIVYWNRAAEELYGFTREEAIGQISHELLHTEFPEPLPTILEALWRDSRWSGELSHASRSGSRIIAFSRWVAERDDKGELIRILESNNDITERVHVQEELRRANLDLEQFAYSASHDLQEPLRTIKIYSQLLTGASPGAAETTEFLGYLRDAATRMELLVRDLLAYAKVNQMERPLEPVAASDALAAALGNLAGAVAESGAEITFEELPAVRVHEMHLQQLFQNLIGNSIKYRDPHRPLAVCIGVRRDNESWVFSVSDNGIGIAAEYKEQIFGLFSRLHNSDKYSGTGIGLAICQRIVERYHGRIWVDSEPGCGSTFHFSLSR